MKKWLFPIFMLMMACAEDGDILPETLDTWSYFDKMDGLSSDRVLTLFEAANGNLWIGTDAGLDLYANGTFLNFDTSDGLVSNTIQAIVEDKDGNIWVGTSNGLNIFIDSELFFFPLFDGVVVTSLLVRSDGNVLIGTEGFGTIVYQFAQDEFSEFFFDDSCGDCNLVNVLFEEAPGKIWIGTEAGLVRMQGTTATSFTKSQGLPDDQIQSLTMDTWGNLWIGTFGGSRVSRYANGKFENIDLANALVQSWVWDMEVDRSGTLWVATAVAGLYRYDGAVMRKDFGNFSDDNLSAILKDREGNMWVGTLFEGLAKYTP